MAGTLSDVLENRLLDHVFGGPDYTRPATVYMALFTVAPSDPGGGTEVNTGVWTNYARAAVANNATNFPAAVAGVKNNGTTVAFGTASITGTAPTILGFGIYDAASGGNLMAWASFTGQVVANGSPISIPITGLTVTMD
jgi:hypothetical protein